MALGDLNSVADFLKNLLWMELLPQHKNLHCVTEGKQRNIYELCVHFIRHLSF